MALAWVLLVAGATLPSHLVTRSCGMCAQCNCSLRRPFPIPKMLRLETMQFDGKLLGVSASVLLDKREQRALINLRGVPVGGSLTGMAWFKEDGESVEVERELYNALSKRGVAIINAGAYKDYSYVWVRVQLPLGLGTHRIILPRTVTKKAVYATQA